MHLLISLNAFYIPLHLERGSEKTHFHLAGTAVHMDGPTKGYVSPALCHNIVLRELAHLDIPQNTLGPMH